MLGVVAEKPMGMKWRLKIVMAERDMSAKKLSELTGLTYGAIIRLRKEEPVQMNIDTLTKLCKALDCTPDDLMQITEDPDPK